MAQLLVFLRNNTHENPDKQKAGCYQRGDIVCVFDDSHIFGSLEGPPDFQIVRVDGQPEDFAMYLDTGEYRRNFSFNIDAVQPQQLSLRALSEDLQADVEAVISITPEVFESNITDKRS